MFGQILGKATDLLGKAFILAGAIPAMVLLFGFGVLTSGTASIEAMTRAADAKSLTDALAWLVSVLALGAVLFVLRGRLVDFVAAVPGNSLEGLREFMIARQLRGSVRADRQRTYWTDAVTAARWYELDFAVAPEPPDTRPSPFWWHVVRAATRARRELGKFVLFDDPTRVLGARACRRVSLGLLALRAYFHEHPDEPAVRDELAAWRGLLHGPSAERVRAALVQVAGYCHRQWFFHWINKQSQPDASQIQPTEFGNAIASLGGYAKARYGMQTATLWSRLSCLLPESERKEVAELRTVVEALIVLWFCVLLLFGYSLVVLAGTLATLPGGGAEAWRPALVALLVLIVAATVAPFLYSLALVSLQALIEKIKALVDVYHVKLLQALGLQPKDTGEVIHLLVELDALINQGQKRAVVRELSGPPRSAAQG